MSLVKSSLENQPYYNLHDHNGPWAASVLEQNMKSESRILIGFQTTNYTVFHKIVKLVKNGVLMIIHIYAKVSPNKYSLRAPQKP
jgi:SPX domain protein involved in polyphosphate accumulation